MNVCSNHKLLKIIIGQGRGLGGQGKVEGEVEDRGKVEGKVKGGKVN